MTKFWINPGTGDYYLGDCNAPGDVEVPERPTPMHAWSDGAWVLSFYLANAAVAEARYQREIAGVTWGDLLVRTDRVSQSKLLAERMAIMSNRRVDGRGWKFYRDGVPEFRPTSNAAIILLADGVHDYVSACYEREEQLLAKVAADEFVPADLAEGWPDTVISVEALGI